MCKLFMATGKLSTKQISGALAQASHCFQSQNDGFGFLAAGQSGRATGRYLEPAKFPGAGADYPAILAGEHEEIGEVPADTDTLLIHGRTGTGGKGLVSVHPFLVGGSYLVHNGSVRWTGKKKDEPAPVCDSHQLLVWIMEQVTNQIDPWGTMHSKWAGWGAIGFYNGPTGILTILRDGAQLSIARRVKKLGWVMATQKEELLSICHTAGIGLAGLPISFPDDTILQIKGGEIIYGERWKGFSNRNWTATDTVAYGGFCGQSNGANGFHYEQKNGVFSRVEDEPDPNEEKPDEPDRKAIVTQSVLPIGTIAPPEQPTDGTVPIQDWRDRAAERANANAKIVILVECKHCTTKIGSDAPGGICKACKAAGWAEQLKKAIDTPEATPAPVSFPDYVPGVNHQITDSPQAPEGAESI